MLLQLKSIIGMLLRVVNSVIMQIVTRACNQMYSNKSCFLNKLIAFNSLPFNTWSWDYAQDKVLKRAFEASLSCQHTWREPSPTNHSILAKAHVR